MFTKSVYGMVTECAALRVKTSYKQFFERGSKGYPKFHSWKNDWFSLEYTKPNTQGIKINDKQITFTLGKDSKGKQMHVTGTLNSLIKYDKHTLNTVTLTKERHKSGDKFFVCFSCDIPKKREITEDKTRWCSIDPNHKNMFVMLDYQMDTFEFSVIQGIKDLDKQIDKLQTKMSLCRNPKIKKIYDKNNEYLETIRVHSSNRHKRLSKAIDGLRNKRREQTKQLLYTIAHFLCKRYDYIMIGDYTPSIDLAQEKGKRRSMLNQSFIGKFRSILKHVASRSYKNYQIINERGTTATCSCCGYYEKKDPSVRVFTCPTCKNTFNRDVNSCINIAKKGDITFNLSSTDYLTLKEVKYNVSVNRRVLVAELQKLDVEMDRETTKRSSDVGKSNLNKFTLV